MAKDFPAHPVVLFDGDCNLCSASVDFVVRRDPEERFRFVALRSETGRKLLDEHGLPADHLSSVVLIEGGRAYAGSTAALRIARRLRWPWPVLSLLLAVPCFARDFVYRFIARRRYAWFGRSTSCQLPGRTPRRSG